MIVRRAQANDIATIQALENEAFGLTWDRATFQKELERPNGFTAVAELEGRTAGPHFWFGPPTKFRSILSFWEAHGEAVGFRFRFWGL